jgi:hypothetical protein
VQIVQDSRLSQQELFVGTARGQARRERLELTAQSDVQAASQERDELVSLDARLFLVKDDGSPDRS